MSRIKRLVRPEAQAVNWKTAVVLSIVAGIFMATFAHAAAPVAVDMLANTLQPILSRDGNIRHSLVTSSNVMQQFQSRSTVVDQYEDTKAIADQTSSDLGANGSEVSKDKLIDVTLNSQSNLTSENLKSEVGTGILEASAMKEVFERTVYGITQKVKSNGVDFTNPACVPLYPRRALREHTTGTTTLNVTTDDAGYISTAEVAESSGSDSLDNALIKSLTSNDCRISLGSQGGIRAKSTFPVSYTWKIDHQF